MYSVNTLIAGARFKGMSGLVAMQRNYGAALVNWALEIESGIESLPYDQAPCPASTPVCRCGRESSRSCWSPTWRASARCAGGPPRAAVEQTDNLVTPGGTFLVWNPDYDVLYRDFYVLRDCQPISYLPSAAA